ncbi:MAG: ATP-binding protein [Parcubacteria group bacterium]|nr:ATP-binding protein [Parcubacteria group bacterium]
MTKLTKEHILQEISRKGRVKSSELAALFGVSRQYVSRVLSLLVKERRIIKVGSTRSAFYTTEEYLKKHKGLEHVSYTKTFVNKGLEEHVVFEMVRRNLHAIDTLPENIRSIVEYAFSEMLNNAIEHSQSAKIKVFVSVNATELTFTIDDFGIGVFRNIMRKRGLKSEIEAIQDLLKGKMTTAPKLHSGEGIFFTSKAGDEFLLDSYGHQFIANNVIKDLFVKKVKGQRQGTRVTFRINTHATYHLNDIFQRYTNIGEDSDYGFDKTEVHVWLYALGGVHISRSQARRVLSGLETFKVVVMDYDRIPTVGQAFADEVYRVFAHKRPDIEIQDIHMNEAVAFMVRRARKEAEKKK